MHDLDRLDISELLQHRDFVRRLAARLVSDADLAQDVEQRTWQRALEHGGSQVRSPRRWLATVVRNLARSEHRRARREQARRRKVRRPAPVEDPATTLQRQETIELLMRSVLALDADSRQALLLRYFQDRTPTEISALTCVPVETIRTRIKRALARLRQRLDRDSIGEWRPLLLPIAALSAAPTATAAGVSVESSLRTLLPARWILGLKLVAIGAIGLSVWIAVEPLGRLLSLSTEAQPASGEGAEHPIAVDRPSSLASADEPPASSSNARDTEADGPGVVRGLIVEAPNGRPISGARIVLMQRETGSKQISTSDQQGHFRFEGVAPGPYLLGDARWSELTLAERHTGQWLFEASPLDVRDAGDLSFRLEADRRHGVLGRIVMPESEVRIADLRLDVAPVDPDQSRPFLSDPARRTDPQGRFEWWLERGIYRVLMDAHLDARVGELLIGIIDLEDPDAAMEWTFDLPWPGAIEGRVVDPSGEPVEGAQVELLAVDSMLSSFEQRGESTDELGRFRLEHLPVDRDLIVRARHESEITNTRGPIRAGSEPVPTVEITAPW